MTVDQTYDVIVIGSGIGGLTAAAILTRLKGKRVLVLEKHYVAGGQTHEFHRNQYSWDIGIHYVGAIAPGEQARLLFDLVTGKQVEWNAMPDTFDRFVYPDFTIDAHKDPEIFAANLIQAFPAEERAIRQYFRDLASASNWYIANFLGKFADWMVRMPFVLKSWGKGKLARMTVQDYVDRSFKDDKLKAVLASQWGDYGLPPERASFGLHALVTWSYSGKTGAFFPEGGGRAIAPAAEKVITLQGGRILVDTEVSEILVRDGAAYGVRARQSNGWQGEFHAETIISNVGAEQTFADLVPKGYCHNEREELATFEQGTSFVTLYLGLSKSPEKFGIKGENYWIYENYQHTGSTNCVADLIAGKANYGFVSFPSMKNRQAHAHTAEVCVCINPDSFHDWSERPGEYYQAKEKITASLLDLLERHFPGFGEIIDYAELSTPVTMQRFTSRPRGEPYGIPGTPARFDLKALKPKTSIKNLYLSGSDVCSLGIVGALQGGAAAAACVIGPMGFMRIMIGANIADKKPAPKFIEAHLSAHKISGAVLRKTQKTDAVIELQIKINEDISFRPGQHIDLQVNDKEQRAYSVLSLSDNVMTLIIDTSPGGPGSQYIEGLATQEMVAFSAPKGNFLLNNMDAPVCFISTGTGMVPLRAMLEEYLATTRCDIAPKFIFGTGKQADNYMPEYLEQENTDITYCLSREENGIFFKGRITHYLESEKSSNLKFPETDFYICGNPNMVQDVQKLLRKRGARRVFVEYY
jgi:phytoene dehydrogenase-like protein/NAD(P)H-flavin reductase